MSFAIRTEKLVKRFRSVEALRSLTLAIPENSIYALVGANGAGKTTTIKILMNILRPTSGHAEVLGKPSIALRAADFAQIGYVSENQEMPDWMRVSHFLAYLRPFYPSWDTKLEAELVRQFDLPLDRKLKTLSRGMRMKAALASSLAYRPRLIILDEPFSGLDPLVREELIESLLESASDTTVFISSHDLAEIENVASHVAYLESGSVLFGEEMSVLRERFRELEVSCHHSPSAPEPMPPSWIRMNISGKVVRFVDTNYDEKETPGLIRSVFAGIADITPAPMSLREIFVAVARSESGRRMEEKR